MALSTTIIRASPTPPVEPFENGNILGFSKSPDPLCHAELPGLTQKTSDVSSRSDNEFHKDYGNIYDKGSRHSEPGQRLYTQGDSGYSSKLNIQHPPGAHVLRSGSHFAIADDMTYGASTNYSTQGALVNLPSGVPNLLTGRSLFGPQLAQQYLSSEGSLHTPAYQLVGPCGLYGVSATMSGGNPHVGHMHVPGPSLQSGYMNTGQHPSQYPVGKNYGQPSVGSWAARDLADLRSECDFGKITRYLFDFH